MKSIRKIAVVLTASLFLSIVSPTISPIFAQEAPPNTTPQITSFSPTTLIPGETVLTITGNNFGEPFNSLENLICFGSLYCYDANDLNGYLQSWTNTSITLLVPDDIQEAPNYIVLRTYFADEALFNYIQSTETYIVEAAVDPGDDVADDLSDDAIDDDVVVDDVSDDDLADDEPLIIPEITSFSPTALVPGVTIITISGSNFGNQYIPGLNQICFGEDCILDDYIDYYLISWTDAEIQVYAPEFLTLPAQIWLLVNAPGTELYDYIASPQEYTVTLPEDPEITSISPTVLTPDETVVTITGSGFGDSYSPDYNQICFGEYCIANESIDYYLQKWTDTEIVLLTPYFVTQSGTIDVRVYIPSTGYFDYISSPVYTTKQKPVIEWYYPEMDQSASYIFSGSGFGNFQGKVVINGIEADIVSWSDTDVEFIVPSIASSGYVYIESADGAKSQELYVDIYEVQTYSDDELSKYQWHFDTINMKKAWEITEGSSDVIVAVIDSGVDITHEDLKHAIWKNADEIAGNNKDDDNNGYIDDIYGWDFVSNTNSTTPTGSHGTMVASMIAAKKDNGIGIAGVAPNVKIMALNTAIQGGLYIDVDAALYAIKYAVDNGADIINMSFGGLDSLDYYAEAVQYAYDNDVLIVSSNGNEDIDLDDYNTYAPVCVDLGVNAVLGIAATDKNNLRSYFSNYGEVCTDLSAPGEGVPLAVPTGTWEDGFDYELADGTSFSSPLVAGIAALIKSKHSDWNVEEIKYVLLHTAVDIDSLNSSYSGKLGYGVPDAYAALTASKPNVSYDYNPSEELDIQETNETIEVEVPEPEPITAPEPIKDDSIEKDIEPKTDKSTSDKFVNISPFSDVENHEYQNAITYLKENGIVNGYEDGTFKPDIEINRAEFIKIVVGAFIPESAIYGSNCFPDVKEEWFAPYICTAKDIGVISGYPDGTFKPDRHINLVEALKIILEIQGMEFYSDPDDDWFAPYIAYAVQTDLDFIFGKRKFDENISRGDMAELIYLSIK